MAAAVRPASVEDAPGIARVHVESWRTTYTGIIPDSYLYGLSVTVLEPRWRDRLRHTGSIVFVAESSGGEVVGFASGGLKEGARSPEYEAELYTIYLLRQHQRGGAGRRLFAAVADGLRQEGRGSMLLWVLKDNPARGFYEKLGGKLLGDRKIEIGGARLTEVAYGWEEIGKIAEESRASGQAEC